MHASQRRLVTDSNFIIGSNICPRNPAESANIIHCLWCVIIKCAFCENQDQPPLCLQVFNHALLLLKTMSASHFYHWRLFLYAQLWLGISTDHDANCGTKLNYVPVSLTTISGSLYFWRPFPRSYVVCHTCMRADNMMRWAKYFSTLDESFLLHPK